MQLISEYYIIRCYYNVFFSLIYSCHFPGSSLFIEKYLTSIICLSLKQNLFIQCVNIHTLVYIIDPVSRQRGCSFVHLFISLVSVSSPIPFLQMIQKYF